LERSGGRKGGGGRWEMKEEKDGGEKDDLGELREGWEWMGGGGRGEGGDRVGTVNKGVIRRDGSVGGGVGGESKRGEKR